MTSSVSPSFTNLYTRICSHSSTLLYIMADHLLIADLDKLQVQRLAQPIFYQPPEAPFTSQLFGVPEYHIERQVNSGKVPC